MEEDKSKSHESFTAKLIFFMIGLIIIFIVYPQLWNVISKFAHYPTLPGYAFFRWDFVLRSKGGTLLAISSVICLLALVLYTGKVLDGSKSKGLVVSGSEYGSARWSTDEEMKSMFYNITIDSMERQKRLFHIWRLPKNKADTKL